MSGKIWVVSEGQYSDYSVIAVFQSEKLADEAVAAGMGDGTEDLPYYDSMPVPVEMLTISCEIPTPTRQKEGHFGRRFFQEWENTRKLWPHQVEFDPPVKVKQMRWGASRLVYHGTDFKAVRHAFGEHKSQIRAHWEEIV